MSEDMKDLFGNVVTTAETKTEGVVAEVEAEAKTIVDEVVHEIEITWDEAKAIVGEGVAYVEGLFHKTEAEAVNMNSTLDKAVDTELKSVVVEAEGTANGSAK